MIGWIRRLFGKPAPGGRKKLGELAIEKGWVTEKDICDGLEIQYEESKKNPDHSFRRIGEILVEMKKITKDQLKELLELQNHLD